MRAARIHLAVTVPLVLATAVTAHAQALVPAKGEGLVSIQFANTLSKDHFLLDQRYDRGHTDTQAMLFDFTYGLTDRVAVSVGLPVNVSRYSGSSPHRFPDDGPIPLDDGAWHTSTQDFRFALRYNAVRGPIVLTPFISTNLPSYGYEFYAHSAPGPRVKELHGGLAAARLFADLGLVVQGRYSLAFAEEVLEVSRRYSVAMVEVAYFLRPSLRVVAMTSSRIGHNGIELPPDVRDTLEFDVFYHHDRISRESIVNVGGGLGVSLSDTWDLFGSYMTTVSGRNTHAVNRGINIGVTWSFTRGGAAALPSVRNRDAREGALVKCLCQKAS